MTINLLLVERFVFGKSLPHRQLHPKALVFFPLEVLVGGGDGHVLQGRSNGGPEALPILTLLIVWVGFTALVLNLGRVGVDIVAIRTNLTIERREDIFKDAHLVRQNPKVDVMKAVAKVGADEGTTVVPIGMAQMLFREMAVLGFFDGSLAESVATSFPILDNLQGRECNWVRRVESE